MHNIMIRTGLRFVCLWFFTLGLFSAAGGCWQGDENTVVVYTALDREFSEPILNEFEEKSRVRVLAKYDVESTKTVGLANALIQEQNQPRCDVFWNNEILHTLRLEKKGLLEAYVGASANKYPSDYQSPRANWFGFAARARVLLVNESLVREEERPSSIRDLTNKKWQGKVGIAKPLFGTTATHAAVLFHHWGEKDAEEFFRQVKVNAQIMSGNKQVALAVGAGQLAFGLTDTDDAIAEIEKGLPVQIVFPDQGAKEMGALFIPNTLCILKNCPHREQARRLVDFLLTAEVEAKLADGASAQFPLHMEAKKQPRFYTEPARWMEVDFRAAADAWDKAAQFLEQEFASTP